LAAKVNRPPRDDAPFVIASASEAIQCGGGAGLDRPIALLLAMTFLSSLRASAKQSRTASMKQPAVYIMASRRNGTLYTGVTSHPLTFRHCEERSDAAIQPSPDAALDCFPRPSPGSQ
jgi:hypothetical protein